MSNTELAEWEKMVHDSRIRVLYLGNIVGHQIGASVFKRARGAVLSFGSNGSSSLHPTLDAAKRATERALRRELEAALARLGERGKE